MKNKLDQFYTKPEIVDICLETLDFDSYDLLIEPSAGTGEFYRKLPVKKRIGMDVDPKYPGIVRMDFFSFVPKKNRIYATVGNPPFGKNSSVAVSFFNKAASFSTTIGFILPRTFRKVSIQNRLNVSFHLLKEIILPLESFYLLEGQTYSVPSVFHVWERRDYPRKKIKLSVSHKDFRFVSMEKADLAVRRVGVMAGKPFDKNIEKMSRASHYFLRIFNPKSKSVFYKLWEDHWCPEADKKKVGVKYDTVGNPSISKTDLILYYSENYD